MLLTKRFQSFVVKQLAFNQLSRVRFPVGPPIFMKRKNKSEIPKLEEILEISSCVRRDLPILYRNQQKIYDLLQKVLNEVNKQKTD